MEKPEWWGYPTVKKLYEDMYNRLDRIPACDGGTDGQTSCHGIVRAMHTLRAVKMYPWPWPCTTGISTVC